MQRRQNNKAVRVLLDESVHAVVLELVELYFLADAVEVHDKRRVADGHLEGKL